jgi:hypothetical protein
VACCSATTFGVLTRSGTNHLRKVDRAEFTQRTGCQLRKESAVLDLMRLTIKQIKEILLQRFPTNPCLARERATGGFRDPANLESNHENASCHALFGLAGRLRLGASSQALPLASRDELTEPVRRVVGDGPAVAKHDRLEPEIR